MTQDVRKYVRNCKECQLAKGYAPKRQGFLRGRHHSRVMNQLNLDLIGPISEGLTGHVEHDKPCYIWVATDPFSHMVWLEVISSKDMYTVTDAFIRRILLEEGIPRLVITDNGSEFSNKMREDLLSYLRVEYGYTPPYDPRANYAERVNRWIGETLRTVVNSEGSKKRDWHKYVKYLEFAYRRMPIPGTNVTPFMVARGRQPTLPHDEALEQEDLPTATPPVEEHTKKVQEAMEWAKKEVLRARETAAVKRKETFDATHIDERFDDGERVRLYKDVPARRDPRTGELQASKLQLKNAVYSILSHEGYVYTVKNEETGRVRTAHVSQLARFYDEETSVWRPVPQNLTVTPGKQAKKQSTQQELWSQLSVGTHIVFQDKDWDDGILHVGEVVRIDTIGSTVDVWYYLQNQKKGGYNWYSPFKTGTYTPEYVDHLGATVLKPKVSELTELAPRQHMKAFGDIHIIANQVSLQTGGKMGQPVLEKVDAYLREMVDQNPKVLRALNFPTDEEIEKREKLKKKKT